MKTLIRNGRIVTAVDDYKADVLIEDEVVAARCRMACQFHFAGCRP